ncbi:methyltransferase domain-containing protein [soil metagenome]
MNSLIHYSQCPVCDSGNIVVALTAEDYTVTHEKFEVWHCNDCTCRFTQNAPAPGVIGKYYQSDAYVSHSDTKQGLVNRLYHLVRNYTLQSKRKLVTQQIGKANASLLDVGAGTGAFAATMQQAGWKVTALEPDATAKENALKNYALKLGELDAIFSLGAESFDVITMWHVLEHVHQLHEYINAYQSILKKDGTLIIAVPNYTSSDAEKYHQFWAAYDVPRHLYHFSPESIYTLMQHHGFQIKTCKPMWFDSFYVAMLSEQYKTGNQHLVSAVWTGLRSNMKALSDARKCSSVIYIIKKK